MPVCMCLKLPGVLLVGLENCSLEMFKFTDVSIEPALNHVSNRIEVKQAEKINQIIAMKQVFPRKN